MAARGLFLWLGALGAVLWTAGGCEKPDTGRLEASGTIEAEDVRVSTTVGGKVAEVLAREGDHVDKDQVLLRFDPTDISLQGGQARAALRLTQAQQALAQKGARPEDIASAKELMNQATIGMAAAEADMKRAEELAPEGAVTDKQLDDARSRYNVISSQRRTAELQYRKALNGARPEELDMAAAGVAQAEAMVALLEKKIADCEVRAVMSGTVIHRLLEPGEVGGPGSTLFVLQDLGVVKLTVFVPESDIGKVRLGAPVSIYIDSHPGRAFPGRISRVRDQAEFTPRNVQTKDERIKLVFGVEIEVENPEGFFKPGMPADAVFDEGTGPRKAEASGE